MAFEKIKVTNPIVEMDGRVTDTFFAWLDQKKASLKQK